MYPEEEGAVIKALIATSSVIDEASAIREHLLTKSVVLTKCRDRALTTIEPLGKPEATYLGAGLWALGLERACS